MCKRLLLVSVVWLVSLLGGCAGLTNPDFEPPVVSLSSFRMLPQSAASPRFEIGLHIINPNRQPLSFEGIYYTVTIEDYNVLAGVSNDLPTVAPYGEADILLEAGVDVVKSVKLLSSLVQEPRDRFRYSFNAKLDPGGFSPRILVQEEGEFNLQN